MGKVCSMCQPGKIKFFLQHNEKTYYTTKLFTENISEYQRHLQSLITVEYRLYPVISGKKILTSQSRSSLLTLNSIKVTLIIPTEFDFHQRFKQRNIRISPFKYQFCDTNKKVSQLVGNALHLISFHNLMLCLNILIKLL